MVLCTMGVLRLGVHILFYLCVIFDRIIRKYLVPLLITFPDAAFLKTLIPPPAVAETPAGMIEVADFGLNETSGSASSDSLAELSSSSLRIRNIQLFSSL